MSGTSLLALIDDITSVLDDVALMTKVAAKKATGVVGDDLALNANQVAGANADRELPIVWSVAKGSIVNKVILVPLALLVSYLAPILIVPTLMLGGVYLCYEGSEKIIEKLFHKKSIEHDINDQKELTTELEKEKIKGAIRTDFVLSAEIIVIALGAVATSPILYQAIVLGLVSILMTVGVYGLVAVIVKVDDFGLWLMKSNNNTTIKIGQWIVNIMPKFMKLLTVVGTVAMFSVGGSILTHGIPKILELSHSLNFVTAILLDVVIGITTGLITVAILEFKNRIINYLKK